MLKKGYRKVFICVIGFIWAMAILLIVWLLFRKNPEILASILIATYSFGSSLVLYLFASNAVVHKIDKDDKE